MNRPLVSVIIPVYNIERYLEQCLESVIRQSHANLQIILVDDGSSDASPAICARYRPDARVQVIRLEHGGPSHARNAGLEVVRGDYITFVDGDDQLAPDMIEKLYEALTRSRSDLAVCRFRCVDEEQEIIPSGNVIRFPKDGQTASGEDVLRELQKKWHLSVVWGKLYRASLLAGIRFPEGRHHEDEFVSHHIFARCARVVFIRTTHYDYVQREHSLTHQEKTGRSLLSRLDAVEAFLERSVFLKERNLPEPAALSWLYARTAYAIARLQFLKCGTSAQDESGSQADRLNALREAFARHADCLKKANGARVLASFLDLCLYRLTLKVRAMLGGCRADT